MYYFDNAATSYPKPEEVYKFMDEYYRNCGFNLYRSSINSNISLEEIVEDTRNMLLSFFNADNKVVTFLSSATEAMNIVLQGLDYKKINTVYISPFEHNAVLRTIHFLQLKYRFDIFEFKMNKDEDIYDLEGIKYQFQKNKPDLLIINHASNVTGLIAPIHEICTLAKNYDAISVVDIAQSAGQIYVDLKSNDIDYAIFTGHKSLLGAFGVGGFICNKNISLNPLIYGGTGKDSANLELPTNIPSRFEVGSTNILAISSINAALKWIVNNDFNHIIKEKSIKTKQLIKLLQNYSNIKVYRKESNENYVNVVSCNYQGYSSENIGKILSDRGIILRTGLHCAPNAHKYLGTFPEGTIRFSIGYFTKKRDFDALEEALDYIEENS